MAAMKNTPKKADMGSPAIPDEPQCIPAGKYRLTHLMNVRKAPSVDAEKAGTKTRGTEVDVISVDGDWLRLDDGTFILYGGGEYAEKV